MRPVTQQAPGPAGPRPATFPRMQVTLPDGTPLELAEGATVVLAALTWLRRNAAPHHQVTVLAGDVGDTELLAELSGRADAVLSNPPYIAQGGCLADVTDLIHPGTAAQAVAAACTCRL